MNTKSIITFVLVTVGILAGAVALLWKFGNTEVKPIEGVAGEERHVKGEGPVTIVEFSDLQCPACRSVQAPLKEILAKYEGKVRLVYRHFPLSTIHKNAFIAAYATEAADKQNKFWEMHDLLFERQPEWEELDDPREKFGEYANELGLELEQFRQELESQEVREAVNKDSLDATRFRLTGTPSFFVNGVPVEFGALDTKLSESVN